MSQLDLAAEGSLPVHACEPSRFEQAVLLTQWAAPISIGDLLLPIHLRTNDLELRIFSTIMTLGTPTDVTLQELRIETFFPADEPSERAWRQIVVE